MTTVDACIKCGAPKTGAAECHQCGVIHAKAEAAYKKTIEEETASAPLPPEPMATETTEEPEQEPRAYVPPKPDLLSRLQKAGAAWAQSRRNARPICTHCGYQGPARRYTKGSFFMEIFLWFSFFGALVLFFWTIFLPVLIGIGAAAYSLWRVISAYKGCPTCGTPRMIPADSPMAPQIKQRLGLQ